MATYLRAGGVIDRIEGIQPDSLESTVRSLWVTLLPIYYSAMQGYGIEVESMLEDDTRPDIIVVKGPYSQDSAPNGDLLMLECKKPSEDRPGVWNDTRNFQLRNYLAGNRNANRACYGGIAIGRKVVFYKWVGNVLTPLSTILEVDKIGPSNTIEQLLEYFKRAPEVQ